MSEAARRVSLKEMLSAGTQALSAAPPPPGARPKRGDRGKRAGRLPLPGFARPRAAPLPPPAAADGEPIDLHTLLAQFTALRHEVHLQTRAARAQQEQGAETLRQFAETLAAFACRPAERSPR